MLYRFFPKNNLLMIFDPANNSFRQIESDISSEESESFSDTEGKNIVDQRNDKVPNYQKKEENQAAKAVLAREQSPAENQNVQKQEKRKKAKVLKHSEFDEWSTVITERLAEDTPSHSKEKPAEKKIQSTNSAPAQPTEQISPENLTDKFPKEEKKKRSQKKKVLIEEKHVEESKRKVQEMVLPESTIKFSQVEEHFSPHATEPMQVERKEKKSRKQKSASSEKGESKTSRHPNTQIVEPESVSSSPGQAHEINNPSVSMSAKRQKTVNELLKGKADSTGASKELNIDAVPTPVPMIVNTEAKNSPTSIKKPKAEAAKVADNIPKVSLPKENSVHAVKASQSALMEKLVSNLHQTDLKNFKGEDGNFLPLDKWPNVKLNIAGDVKEIRWGNKFHQKNGSLDFRYLPQTLRVLSAPRCNLVGTLDLSILPKSLEVLNLACNQFYGALSFKGSPPNLSQVDLSLNKLTGTIAFHECPSKLKELNLSHNDFGGGIDFSSISAPLELLNLRKNAFKGTADFSTLSETFRVMDIAENMFTGQLLLNLLPSKLEKLSAEQNSFSKEIFLDNLPWSMKFLNISKNSFEGSVSLVNLPPMLSELHLSENKLSGELVLTSLPKSLRKLFAQKNYFSGFLNLGELPENLEELVISDNKLSGSVSIEKLPPKMVTIDLCGNRLCGSLRFLDTLPPLIEKMAFDRNQFENYFVMSKKFPESLKELRVDIWEGIQKGVILGGERRDAGKPFNLKEMFEMKD